MIIFCCTLSLKFHTFLVTNGVTYTIEILALVAESQNWAVMRILYTPALHFYQNIEMMNSGFLAIQPTVAAKY